MKGKASTVIVLIIYMIMGGACGYFGLDVLGPQFSGLGGSMMAFGLMLLLLGAAFYVQMILHEAGHLICGLLSGYRFSSFRVGTIMLITVEGRLVHKKFSVAGTGGQCLMVPPDCKPEDCPFLLYNLGGALANILAGLLFGALWLAFPGGSPLLSAFVFNLFLTGIALGVMNAIPMRSEQMVNDGYNIYCLRKDARTRRAFWIQLTVSGRVTQGERLKDMKAEWFQLSPEDDLENPFIGTIGQYRCEYFVDRKELEEAERTCRKLLSAGGLLGIQRSELLCSLLFLELMGRCREKEIGKLYTKQLQKYIEQTACYVSRQRLMYAYELLGKNKEEEAEKQLESFEKTARDYPYSGDLAAERELLLLVRARKEEKELQREMEFARGAELVGTRE